MELGGASAGDMAHKRGVRKEERAWFCTTLGRQERPVLLRTRKAPLPPVPSIVESLRLDRQTGPGALASCCCTMG